MLLDCGCDRGDYDNPPCYNKLVLDWPERAPPANSLCNYNDKSPDQNSDFRQIGSAIDVDGGLVRGGMLGYEVVVSPAGCTILGPAKFSRLIQITTMIYS